MNLIEIYEMLIEGLMLPISYLTNPEKRIHYIYLGSSAFLAYLVYKNSNIKTSFYNYLFSKKVWLNQSAYVDYVMLFFNGILKVTLIAPYIIYGIYLSIAVSEFLMENFGYASYSISNTAILILYTLAITLADDFAAFIVHLTVHKNKLLWEFHKVHHSATSLNPFTQYRIHPIELIIINIRRIITFGIITGIFDYFSQHQINMLVFFGVNVFSGIFLFLGANLRHSHVQLKYFTFLEYIFISPYQHQIHHSNNADHYNKNMGTKLALWDWLFGTLILSKSVGQLEFGLGQEGARYFSSFAQNMVNPFKNVFRLLNNRSRI